MGELISEAYMKQQRELHAKGDYGISGHRHADTVAKIKFQSGCDTVLDYGCGRALLSHVLPNIKITNYDPCIDRFSARPEPHDLVYCGDVMEHVEEELVDNVLDDIKSLAKKVAIFNIFLAPATKVLPDGRNAHITLKPYEWWLEKLMSRFTVVSLQHVPGGEITVVCDAGGKNAPKA